MDSDCNMVLPHSMSFSGEEEHFPLLDDSKPMYLHQSKESSKSEPFKPITDCLALDADGGDGSFDFAVLDTYTKEKKCVKSQHETLLQLNQAKVPEGIEVQYSEACPTRFVIFDQTGSSARMIMHPRLICDYPSWFPKSSLNIQGAYPSVLACKEKSHFNLTNMKADNGVSNKMIFSHGTHESFKNHYNESDSGCSVTLDNSSEFQEDSSELEALLYSDDEDEDEDEVCSKYNPDGASFISEFEMDGIGYNTIKRQRTDNSEFARDDSAIKRQKTDNLYEPLETMSPCNDNVCFSTLCKPQLFHKSEPVISPQACSLSQRSGIQSRCCESVGTFDSLDNLSSDSTANNITSKATPNSATTKLRKHVHFSRNTQRKSINNAMKMLRGIVPGVENMDNADILDMAVHHLKFLQMKIRRLEHDLND